MKPNIIFECSQYLIVDKASGLVVNKSQNTKEETLQDQLAEYFGLKPGDLGIGDRAGIVHRLDKETSGLLVVAKVQKVFDFLQGEFKARRVKKEYLVLVHGFTNDSGSVRIEITRAGKFGRFVPVKRRQTGGRETETEFKTLKRCKFLEEKLEEILYSSLRGWGSEASPTARSRAPRLLEIEGRVMLRTKSRINYLKKNAQNYSYLLVSPKTGRTHQIRVTLKSIGHPVVSDLIYTPSKLLKFDFAWCPRLFLHAAKLSFVDPATRKLVEFNSDLPGDLNSALGFLCQKISYSDRIR